VELLAALVEAPQVPGERLLDERAIDRLVAGVLQDLDRVEQPPRIAVGKADQACLGILLDLDSRSGEKRGQVLVAQRLQHIDRGARKKGAVHLERRVLGGSADEGDEALLHIWQE